MAKNLRTRKATTTIDDDVAAAEGAEAAEAGPALDAVLADAAPTSSQSKKIRYPCGRCSKEVTTKSLCCQVCEYWYHSDCVPGMTKAYFDNCKLTYDMIGHSAFLCHICQRVVAKFKGAMKIWRRGCW